jgi:hypothetical protein
MLEKLARQISDVAEVFWGPRTLNGVPQDDRRVIERVKQFTSYAAAKALSIDGQEGMATEHLRSMIHPANGGEA